MPSERKSAGRHQEHFCTNGTNSSAPSSSSVPPSTPQQQQQNSNNIKSSPTSVSDDTFSTGRLTGSDENGEFSKRKKHFQHHRSHGRRQCSSVPNSTSSRYAGDKNLPPSSPTNGGNSRSQPGLTARYSRSNNHHIRTNQGGVQVSMRGDAEGLSPSLPRVKRFTGYFDPPPASALPKPPEHWITSMGNLSLNACFPETTNNKTNPIDDDLATRNLKLMLNMSC